jgi:anti-sigma B factor antagonist
MQHSNAYGPLDLGPDAEKAFAGVSGRLTVNLLSDARGVAVKLDGELDLATAPQLDRQLARIEATNVSRVLIDLSGVTFMDSTGLRSIVRAHHFAESNHHTLVLQRGTRQVQRLFELTGIDECLTFEDDEGPSASVV